MKASRHYDHLAPLSASGVHLTKHAAERACDRSISAHALDLALEYGRESHTRGAVVYAVGRKEVATAARLGVDLRRLEGLQVVVAHGGQVLTAYWNTSLHGLRAA